MWLCSFILSQNQSAKYLKWMKNSIVLISLFLLLGCKSSIKKEHSPLKLKGSESLHQVFNQLKKDFEKLQDTLAIELEGGGSRTGLSAIIDRTADIGLSSYEFKLDSLLGTDHQISQKIIAYDGIVVINNHLNPIRKLSNDQISAIYSGKITDWSEVGWRKGQIIPVLRDSNSGTQLYFSTYFKIAKASPHAIIAKENSEILDSVVSNDNGIGFVGYSYFTSMVNNIWLESESDNDSVIFVPPVSLYSGEYPLKRSLRIYFESEKDDRVVAFLKYLNTESAKAIITQHGLILP